MVVSVVLKKSGSDQWGEKEYHYRTELNVAPGALVTAPTASGLNVGKVVRVNVPEEELPAWLRGKLREIVETVVKEDADG